ncbi:helix-turn-helix domain-containing protein [Carnobacterium gallinarum]|uniref:helix-turn-helix transcriptional regulator n=1 Tax=Carnobacterium gallinarum TaxID=2749 RepID=UPI00068DF310|nr:helix-turn-helix transcriptional regulator [Carnobacterium gallinarum]
MKSLGEVIKENRLAKRINQSDLAAGICTQATVSNLENNCCIPNLTILIAISNRLEIDQNLLFDYALMNINYTTAVFNQVKQLCATYKHIEAKELLLNEIDFKKIESAYEIKKYYYYLGLTELIGSENFVDAHYYFNLVLSDKTEKKLDLIDVLATNGVGIAYVLTSEYDKAHTYYEKSLKQLEELVGNLKEIGDSNDVMSIYFNSAKFYSQIENYEKAIELCSQGILLQQMNHTSFELDRLFYEKAFNLVKLGKKSEAEEFYFHAATFAILNKNTIVIESIKKNVEAFNLQTYNYF